MVRRAYEVSYEDCSFFDGLERRKNVSKLLWYIKSGRTTALAMPKRKKSKFLIIDTRSA